ncbi:unnamed protein product [Protopolystoma xenopodis]|uniref:Uncharacterized protein n=1 Tax=Protopolystoma xenopodis TaxID=117903 RepID=A0A3S5FER2_9PLAT|nr:unnamed protein product [Protopolystoma xenopodis]
MVVIQYSVSVPNGQHLNNRVLRIRLAAEDNQAPSIEDSIGIMGFSETRLNNLMV